MKEFSIEQKAKACDGNYKTYTELINRLEDVKEAIKKQNYGIAMDMLYKPYPAFQITTSNELKESEDERIRSLLISSVKNETPIANERNKELAIAWLEKQDEHANFLNKIQIGDKVTRNEDGVLVNFSQLNRVAKKQGENNMGISETTKQELEDNLNKALEKETPESWNEFLGKQKSDELVKEYDFHGMEFVPKFKKGDLIREKLSGRILTIKDFSYDNGLYTYDTGQFPITIQDNYEIIEQNPTNEVGNYNHKEVLQTIINEQNPTWGEEDIHELNTLSAMVANNTILPKDETINLMNWLKQFRGRCAQQPKQEWSKEDKRKIDRIYSILLQAADTHAFSTTCRLIGDKECVELQDFLKSLIPQKQWKPSDEQITWLYRAADDAGEGSRMGKILNELLSDLKKLKGE